MYTRYYCCTQVRSPSDKVRGPVIYSKNWRLVGRVPIGPYTRTTNHNKQVMKLVRAACCLMLFTGSAMIGSVVSINSVNSVTTYLVPTYLPLWLPEKDKMWDVRCSCRITILCAKCQLLCVIVTCFLERDVRWIVNQSFGFRIVKPTKSNSSRSSRCLQLAACGARN